MSDKIASTDVRTIKKLIDMMSENNLVEIELTDEKTKIHLRRPEPKSAEPVIAHYPAMHHIAPAVGGFAPSASSAQANTAVEPAAAAESLPTIKSPIVGTFYTSPSPESGPFVKVGDHVNEETVVCIIEAMKVMNEIKAEMSGVIAEVCASNGQSVEFGQPLFKVKKA